MSLGWVALYSLICSGRLMKNPGGLVNTCSIKAKQGLSLHIHMARQSFVSCFQNFGGAINAITMQCLYAGRPLLSLVLSLMSLPSFMYFISSSAVDNLPLVQLSPHTYTACQARADTMRCSICPYFDEAQLCLTANHTLDRPSFLRRIDCSSTPRVRAPHFDCT
jgi:hypothetical protein